MPSHKGNTSKKQSLSPTSDKLGYMNTGNSFGQFASTNLSSRVGKSCVVSPTYRENSPRSITLVERETPTQGFFYRFKYE